MPEVPITVRRDDAWEKKNENPINATVVNPVGKLPTGTFERVNDVVQDRFSVGDLRNGEQREIGTLSYTEGKDGEIQAIDIR